MVLAMLSFVHGQFLRPSLLMKPGTIVAVMPARSGGDILFLSVLGEKARDIVFVGCETFGGCVVSLSGAVALRFSARRRTSWRP